MREFAAEVEPHRLDVAGRNAEAVHRGAELGARRQVLPIAVSIVDNDARAEGPSCR
jgi:hypothetical protein